tara:strand:+ start:1932 stop:2225 length:294 start_codon:yes stop_codon:yes gene_type:complete
MKKYILIGLIIAGSIILYDLYFTKIREGLKKIEDSCQAKKPDLCVKILDNKEKIKQLNKKTSIVKKAYDEMFKIVQENITLSTNNKKANDALDEQFS